MEYLASFAKRVHICAFPYIPIELTESEIERFLSDSERNARLCPDMLALIFAAIALGAQHSICDNSGERWKVQSVDTEAQRGNVYSLYTLVKRGQALLTRFSVAASMQALRISSFMHKPSLLAIESLVMIGPFLTNSGRFLDAWALFGTTIRLAQAIGLHRHPKYLNPAPLTQRECSTRQTLWWWMLHMDEQYSMTLGRPLGISGMGDCPPPHELTTDPQMLRFGEFINHFTILARQILSGDQLTNAKIDGYTDLLNGLLETMPEMLQFNESWIEKGDELLEWPLSAMAAGTFIVFINTLACAHKLEVYYCKTHTYLILLNRQRTDNHSDHSQTPSAKMPSFRSVNVTSSSHPSPDASTQTSLRGRPLVLKSSEEILVAFLFFYKRAPALLISWTISQQAFNSSMILLLDALETGNLMYIARVQQTYAIFVQLQKNGIHKLAALAVEKLSWGLVQLGKNMEAYRVHQPSEKIVSEQTVRGEADRVTSAFKDTVMSNTGMLLLEESDLQSNAPEHFMPFTWAMPSDQSGITAPSSLKQEQELQSHGKANHMASTRLDDSNETAPIVNELQHNAESPQRSALGQCYAPTSQEYCRLQCRVTGPASSTSFAAPVLQRDHNGGNSTIEQSPPLGLHHFVPPASLGDKSRMRYVTERNEGTDPSQRWNQPVQSPKQHHTPVAKFRHNSFPSLHELTTTPSSLWPTYSSPVVNEAYTSTGIERYNAHSQWPASPAGSIRDNSELGTATSPMSDQKHVVLALHHVSARQQQTTGQCPLPAHSTDARFESVIAENLEQVTGDQWKQWVGNGGSGRRYGSSYFAS